MKIRHYCVVDRIEDDLVVLIDDHGTGLVVPDSTLPAGAREGQVFTVTVDTNDQLDWTTAVRDEAEERRRLEEAKARLERLKWRSGG